MNEEQHTVIHPCYLGDGEFDHDWDFYSDSDDFQQWYWYECAGCGEVDYETDPPEYGDY